MTLVNGPHKDGNNELKLFKLDSPRKRMDGKMGTYMLEYVWRNPATGGVLGSDTSLFTTLEAQAMTNASSLFAHVDLF